MIETRMDGAVMTIVIARPEKKNALTLDMREDLTAAFARAQADDGVRAVILTGAGESFCTGADVDGLGQSDVKSARHRLKHHAQGMIRALHDIEKPVIAVVRGPAAGIGWSLALACDLTVASDTARFSAIFARRGLAPDGGCAWFLARLIGLARAREIVFSTRFVGAEEAANLGLVTRVVPDAELEAAALDLATGLAHQPTFALGMAKRMLQQAIGPGLETFLEYEAVVQSQMMLTADFKEGVDSFLEKRAPRFTGR
jgi:2-(1,2-epoxy-1,2-dihydrophenyl)acetyl-CoA isomerase